MKEKKRKVYLTLISFFLYVLFFLSWIPFYLKTPLVPMPNIIPQIEENLSKIVNDENITSWHELGFDEQLAFLDAKLGDPVFIRIFKEESLLEVWIKVKTSYLLFKTYDICAFSGTLGPKLKEGDYQAPEGFYKVKKSQLNPHSRFHLSFNLGYPNEYDRTHKRTGSYLMVHGACASIGCYAMTDEKIEEIYKLVEEALNKSEKQVWVHAFPFRMTPLNMANHEDSKWYDFWMELKHGYDYFEEEKVPPLVKVKRGHYEVLESNYGF